MIWAALTIPWIVQEPLLGALGSVFGQRAGRHVNGAQSSGGRTELSDHWHHCSRQGGGPLAVPTPWCGGTMSGQGG